MSCNKFIAAVMLFICFGILSTTVYASKSVFIINYHDYIPGAESTVQAYRIDTNHVTLQATMEVAADGTLIDLAAWPQKELLFATNETKPASIVWVSTKTLAAVGQLDTGIPELEFAGIVVDTTG